MIGAGPAGLTVADELLRREPNALVTVLEASEMVGGISRTEKYKGYRMDIGGHRFFSKNEEVNEYWNGIMEMPSRERVSRILFGGKFYDYPVTLSARTVSNMGFLKTVKVSGSYAKACLHKLPEDNLENFYVNRFGRELYEMFFEQYTENLWGKHPREIDADWGVQRVKGLSVREVLKSAIVKRSEETSLIRNFKYPEHGPGEFWEKVAERIKQRGGKIVFQAEVVGLSFDKGIWTVKYRKNGRISSRQADVVVSSAPVKDLVTMLSRAPEKVRKIAEKLPYRDYITIGMLVPELKVGKIKDTWIYVQERGVKLGRVQIYNNWSKGLLPAKNTGVWLGLEYFVQEGDELWKMNERDFMKMAAEELAKIGLIAQVDEVKDYHLVRVKKAYPAYFGSYKNFAVVRKYLDKMPGLYLVGRNGQHRYNNMDHSVLTAMRAVDAIAGSGSREAIWAVNTEKNYHEK